jgi:hypothetical protein
VSIITAWQCVAPEVTVKGSNKFYMSNAVDETCCGMAVKRMGMLGVSVGKTKTLTVKMKTVALIGKGRYKSADKSLA